MSSKGCPYPIPFPRQAKVRLRALARWHLARRAIRTGRAHRPAAARHPQAGRAALTAAHDVVTMDLVSTCTSSGAVRARLARPHATAPRPGAEHGGGGDGGGGAVGCAAGARRPMPRTVLERQVSKHASKQVSKHVAKHVPTRRDTGQERAGRRGLARHGPSPPRRLLLQ
jgi:hypothetical protein